MSKTDKAAITVIAIPSLLALLITWGLGVSLRQSIGIAAIVAAIMVVLALMALADS